MTSPTGSKKKGNNRGKFAQTSALTLIEVLISVVLLASGTVLLMHSFASAWEAVARTDERSTALVFAMSKLADLQLAHQQGQALAGQASGQFRAQSKPFTWSVEVQPNSSSPYDLSQRLTLSVSWPRGAGTDGEQFTLLLAPPPQPAAQEGA